MNQHVNDFTRTTQMYYDELKKYKPLTKAKEKRLLRLSRNGNIAAKNKLLEANLKFVFDIAKHYTGRGLPISDLISEGNMGLLKAVDKFDESRDVKFISYAVWWIKQSITDAIRRNKLISTVEIDPMQSNDAVMEKSVADEEDEKIGGARDTSFSNESEERRIELNRLQSDTIEELLKVLSKREREIIESYYGLGMNEELTLLEIGKKFNLSSERVRQIKCSSLKKLRTRILLLDDIDDLLS